MTSYKVDVIEGPDPRTGALRRGALRFATMDEAVAFCGDTYGQPRDSHQWGVIGTSADEANATYSGGELNMLGTCRITPEWPRSTPYRQAWLRRWGGRLDRLAGRYKQRGRLGR